MNREEAANILDLKTRPEALADFVGPELAGIVHQAMIMGAEALRSPWAKTSDRLPDKCNRYNMYLTIKKRGGGVWQVSGNFIKEHPELCPYWMPIPPLPEVER